MLLSSPEGRDAGCYLPNKEMGKTGKFIQIFSGKVNDLKNFNWSFGSIIMIL